MLSQNCGLSIRSLAELALLISRVTPDKLDESAVPSTASLKLFWQSSRSLERHWMTELDDWTAAGTLAIEPLEQLAPRVFLCEMVARTWGTIIANLDRRRGGDDLTRLARNAVSGLLRIRNGILSRLLTIPESESNRVLNLDRLRRRCDRWTDVLLSSAAIENDCFEFAFDHTRARDFGEESLTASPATGPNVADHLVSAGLRMTFIQQLPDEPVNEPEIMCLMQSILSNIPATNLHRDGTLRTSLERRILASRQQSEGPATLAMTFGGRVKSSTMIPGINLMRPQSDND